MEGTSEIPKGLRHLMTWDGNTLVVHDSGRRRDDLIFALGCGLPLLAWLVGWSMIFVGAAVGWESALGVLFVFVLLLGVPVLGSVGAFKVRATPSQMAIGGGKAVLQNGPDITRPERVSLSGEPGSPVIARVHQGDEAIAVGSALPSLDEVGYTWENLHWYAETIAALLDVPLEDRLDHDRWARWLGSALVRHRVVFHDRVAKSRADHPAPHEARPEQPPDIEFLHDGFTVEQLTVAGSRLTTTHPVSRHRDLADIYDCEPVFFLRKKPKGGLDRYRVGSLLVLTPDGPLEVGWWHEDHMPPTALRWMADRIREAGERLRAGDETDVPQELKILRGQRAKAE